MAKRKARSKNTNASSASARRLPTGSSRSSMSNSSAPSRSGGGGGGGRGSTTALASGSGNAYLDLILSPETAALTGIPDEVTLPSTAFRLTVRDPVTPDANGGFANSYCPNLNDNKLAAVDVAAVWDWTATSTAPENLFTQAQRDAIWGAYAAIRIVAYCIRIEYSGTDLANSGTISSNIFPSEQIIDDANTDTFKDYTNFSQTRGWMQHSVRDDQCVVWRPQDPSSFEYQPTGDTTDTPSLGSGQMSYGFESGAAWATTTNLESGNGPAVPYVMIFGDGLTPSVSNVQLTHTFIYEAIPIATGIAAVSHYPSSGDEMEHAANILALLPPGHPTNEPNDPRSMVFAAARQAAGDLNHPQMKQHQTHVKKGSTFLGRVGSFFKRGVAWAGKQDWKGIIAKAEEAVQMIAPLVAAL